MIANPTYIEWAEFKKRLNPQPNRRTGRKWVEECGVMGTVVDQPGGSYLVYIDLEAWEAGVRVPELSDVVQSELAALRGVL